MKKNEYLCIGKIAGARGVNGEIKINPYTDYPEDFYEIKNIFLDINESPIKFFDLKIHKSQVLMKIKGIENKNDAQVLQGKLIYAQKKDIPINENSYFIEDLKGCIVEDAKSHRVYGTLKDVFNRGASDIYEIVGLNGKEYLLPIIEGTIKEINLDENKILVNPLKGVFDED